jgi:penicillin-binding protein 1A
MKSGLKWVGAIIAAAVVAAVLALWAGVQYLSADLPSVASLRELQLSVPLKIYARDGKLIGEFGAERRALLRYEELPPQLVRAFLAAEDDRFFDHPGVDWQGLLRAAFKLASSGERAQGGSTITMQLARNVFLSSERTFSRKFKEILLSLRIEKELDKQQILELYLNKIYLGERAYGVGAAALVYFNKDVHGLSLAEMALIAGLPKAPSRDNPVANPARAKERRDYVLRRMRHLGDISDLQYEAARAEPLTIHPYRAKVDVDAHYVAEMVRAQLFDEFDESLYSKGLTVVTTIDSAMQASANDALRGALLDYDRRHGWRGPEARLDPALLQGGGEEGQVRRELDRYPPIAGLIAGVVTSFAPDRLQILTRERLFTLDAKAFEWAGLSAKKALAPGDLVRLAPAGDGWRLAQIPRAQAAFVALAPEDGAIRALVGGFDFFQGKFNRVTQARRQAGSGFKPFLYAAGLSYGFTPASVILDAPVVYNDGALESSWRPENYGGDLKGPMRLREALVESRNLVSIRLLQSVGIPFAREYIARFGLPAERLPNDLTMALGTAVFTPLELARGYATIANGGFVVDPWFIDEVRDGSGAMLFKAKPKQACAECVQQRLDAAAGDVPSTDVDGAPAEPAVVPAEPIPADQLAARAIEPEVAWLIADMMHDVTVRGTAARLNGLGRSDLAGKTGTTNDETDAWFAGFQKTLVGVAWVGFDQPTPLGRGEVGGRAALPIWMDFMRDALKGVPQATQPRPAGLVNVRINPVNGRLAAAGDPSAIFETVQQSRIPEPDQEPTSFDDPGKADLEDLY